MSPNPTPPLHLQLMADMVCPWCFIGKRSLDLALPILAGHGIQVAIEWLPFQLNPNLPAAGMDRKALRSGRFGSWANALAEAARATSVAGVPAYRVDGKLVLSGAQSVDGYVEALVAAARP